MLWLWMAPIMGHLLKHQQTPFNIKLTNRSPPLCDYERKVYKSKTMVLLLWWRRRRWHIVSHKTSSLLRTEAHDMLTIWIITRHLNSDVENSNSWTLRLQNQCFIFNKRWVLLCDEWGGAESRGNGARPVEWMIMNDTCATHRSRVPRRSFGRNKRRSDDIGRRERTRPGFYFMFCVWQSSVRGCRFSVMFVYFVIKCV